MTKSIVGFLTEHEASSPVSFHMPGHKGAAFFERNGLDGRLKKIAGWDITEISGADNLFQPESVIRETMEKYGKLYGAKKSYLLVNGSSSGIIAAVLASVGRGGKLVMARNCHKSVFNALYLGGIEPVYAFPKSEEEYGISGEITAEEVAKRMDESQGAAAVIIPSPNYYGICSDIKSIAEEVHRRGGILIVDQAHGAHLKFFEQYKTGGGGEKPGKLMLPKAAEELGADIVINSIHKTLASFTQTAVLNVCSSRADLTSLEDKLQMIESSSPSYPLMATLDMNADLLTEKGKALMREWSENIEWFYREASEIEGLVLMKTERMDFTKINLDMSRYGFDGAALEKFLIERGLFPELVSGNIVMCMTGIGNTRRDYERLAGALKELAETAEFSEPAGGETKKSCEENRRSTFGRNTVFAAKLPFAEIPAEKEKILLREAEGRVCAVSVIPYPPGIPIVCPGEIFSGEVIEYVIKQREAGGKVIGVDEDMRVFAGK